MTATQATEVRPARTSSALLLPLLMIMILAGAGVALASVAPSRVTSGIYQVTIGEGPARVTIPTESLGCEPAGDRARCTVAVAGQPLVISIQYAGFDSTCRARHGERMVPCASGLGDHGQASHTVWISDGLGATERDRDMIRAGTPWWRTASGPPYAALALVAALAIVAGLATSLLSRRAREHPARLPAALAIGLLGLILLGASGPIMAPTKDFDWLTLIAPVMVTTALALGAWQYQLGGIATRRAKSIGGALATAAYAAALLFMFLMHGGFIG